MEDGCKTRSGKNKGRSNLDHDPFLLFFSIECSSSWHRLECFFSLYWKTISSSIAWQHQTQIGYHSGSFTMLLFPPSSPPPGCPSLSSLYSHSNIWYVHRIGIGISSATRNSWFLMEDSHSFCIMVPCSTCWNPCVLPSNGTNPNSWTYTGKTRIIGGIHENTDECWWISLDNNYPFIRYFALVYGTCSFLILLLPFAAFRLVFSDENCHWDTK